MRPRDAAAWLRAGRLDAAFISTDTALENEIEDWPTINLGFARSDLVVACRESESWSTAADLGGKTVATHLPAWTTRFFAARGVDATVVSMGGALEGVCAVGMADAIVDLRETGGSLSRNRLRVLEEVQGCEASFVTNSTANGAAIELMCLRITAALNARKTQYLMLHIDADKVDQLSQVFTGLESPIVILLGIDSLLESENDPRLQPDERAELLRDHTRQLYMAFTRAGQHRQPESTENGRSDPARPTNPLTTVPTSTETPSLTTD